MLESVEEWNDRPGSAALRAVGVSHSYDGVSIVEALDFRLNDGETVAIMAPSGAGKSTLLRLLLGLERPRAGDTRIHVAPKEIGVVFQEDSLLPWLDVYENATLLNQLSGKPVDQAALEGLFAAFSLQDFGQHLPRALSTGMKQKVAVCRVLSYQPRLLVLDEGLANMDDWIRFRTCDLLRHAVLESQGSLLVVTHNSTDALHMCDTVLLGSQRPLRFNSVFHNPLPADRDLNIRFTPEFRRALEALRDGQIYT